MKYHKFELSDDEIKELYISLSPMIDRHIHMSELCRKVDKPAYALAFERRAGMLQRIGSLLRKVLHG